MRRVKKGEKEGGWEGEKKRGGREGRRGRWRERMWQ